MKKGKTHKQVCQDVLYHTITRSCDWVPWQIHVCVCETPDAPHKANSRKNTRLVEDERITKTSGIMRSDSAVYFTASVSRLKEKGAACEVVGGNPIKMAANIFGNKRIANKNAHSSGGPLSQENN